MTRFQELQCIWAIVDDTLSTSVTEMRDKTIHLKSQNNTVPGQLGGAVG